MVKLRFRLGLVTSKPLAHSTFALEYGSDLHVNERQKIRHYALDLLKNKTNEKEAKWRFFPLQGTHVNCAIMSMLYTHSIGNQQ